MQLPSHLNVTARPDLRRAGFAAAVAIFAFATLATFSEPHSPKVGPKPLAFLGTAVFAVVAAIAVRSAAASGGCPAKFDGPGWTLDVGK